ncbi:F510_1955 family glycosylhydrolase [Kocuria sp. M4R2S49]|uniref:F510_1955 family glycosylhydrolase n=1 Tax=Kocuria rhizosphaericola TaxID=3376284 RepID=UPI0037B9C16D
MDPLTRRSLLVGGLGLLGTGALAACSPQAESSAPPPSAGDDGRSGAGTAITHVHAITREAGAGTILLATHEGLFRLQDRELTQVGPVVDLMGFTVTPEGRYLASGHPGTGTDLPEPVGLIESTDRGETWEVLSRGGESDFHALAAGPDSVLGFDGQLRASADGRTWEVREIPSAPASLAIAPGTGTVLATTEEGVLRSDDDGATWDTLDTPQLMSLVAWADDRTIVGAGIDGRLLTSRDTGRTWTASAEPVGEITALGAGTTADGEIEALLVAGTGVLRTTDGGNSTEPLL